MENGSDATLSPSTGTVVDSEAMRWLEYASLTRTTRLRLTSEVTRPASVCCPFTRYLVRILS